MKNNRIDVVVHDTNAYYAKQESLDDLHRECVSKVDVRLVIADTEIGMCEEMSHEMSKKELRELVYKVLESLEELVKE